MSKPEPEVASALDRLIVAGLLFRQGVPPHASYLFKHALVQDAAYGTLLREPRRALHARIAEILESQFANIAESQPELVARHCTEAGLIDKAVGLWGKAGQRSLERSALVEAAEQLTRALALIATLQSTRALRREEITFQVALISPLLHIKGYAAPETKAAVERARLLIEHAEKVGEPPADPLLLFKVLYYLSIANIVSFDGDLVRELSAEFLTLALKQGRAVPVIIGHRLVGNSLLLTGEITRARVHYDEAIATYKPAEHALLTTSFGDQDAVVTTLCWRALALWLLGYPKGACRDADRALQDARDMGHAATLMYALLFVSLTHVFCGNYQTAAFLIDELVALATDKDALYWKGYGLVSHGCILALTGKSNSSQEITLGISACRSTDATMWMPTWLSFLAQAYAEVGQFERAWRSIAETMTVIEAAKESWFKAEVNRVAGAIALKSPEKDAAKAEIYFECALVIAREQQAKSWELRAAMSMAQLWRDQGKRREARDLLAPVYGWFTEGFDTLDLKEAKVLLDELSS